MIRGFEKPTCELSEIEKQMVDVFISRFKKRPGRQNAVTNGSIREGIKNRLGIDLDAARIRKIVQYIRVNNLLPGLIATSTGYFYTTSITEIREWIESMRQRERALAESRESMERAIEFLKMRGEQLPINL